MVGALLLGILGLVVVGCIVASIFVRRQAESTAPQPGWRPTDEVFNDPSTNRVMRVWLDGSGERHYVPEAYRKTV